MQFATSRHRVSDPYAHAPKSGEFQRLRRRLTRQVQAAIHEYHMIEPGDHLMVCCSGGKDSYTMLTLLSDLSRRNDLPFTLTAFNLDQGQPGFPTQTLPTYFDNLGIAHVCHFEDTYSTVVEKTKPGKTTCALCSRLRRGIIYSKAAEIGATKIALGHHSDDVIETLMLNLFFGAQIKAMPPKLSALEGAHTLIRPLFNCEEASIARFARAMAYPIIPCNLCGSQPNLQRQAFKSLLNTWEQKFPGRKQALFKACKRVVPSHLADTQLFDFEAMESPCASPTANNPADPADFLAQQISNPTGFMALLEETPIAEDTISEASPSEASREENSALETPT